MQNQREFICKYALANKDVPQLQFIRDDLDGIIVKEFTSGYVNYTFRVSSRDNHNSVIIKHYKPYCKILPDQPTPMIRMRVEYEAMRLLYLTSPGCCPQPYHLDTHMNIVCMEDLSKMTLMWEQFQGWNIDREGMRKLACLLAKLHHSTSRQNQTGAGWQEVTALFRQDHIEETTREYFFSKCFDPDDPAMELGDEMKTVHQIVISNPYMVETFSQLRDTVREEQCLIHGDCSERSVFYSPNRCAIFDLEFCTPGHKALDLAHALCDMVIIYHIVPTSHQNYSNIKDNIKEATNVLLETYCQEHPEIQKEEKKKEELLSVVCGVLAVYIFRTVTFFGFNSLFTMGATYMQRAELMTLSADILHKYQDIHHIDAFLQAIFDN